MSSTGKYDAKAVEKASRDLLIAIGEDPDRDGLVETPRRLARAWAELTAGTHTDPSEALTTVFDIDHEEMVLVRDIPFFSQCEHHMLPFYGVAHVAYIPQHGKVTGLSKLARVVEGYARRLQVQERLTGQIASALMDRLDPYGVAVVLEAEHMCMTMRGIKKPGSKTVTSVLHGTMRTDPRTRAEALSLIMSKG